MSLQSSDILGIQTSISLELPCGAFGLDFSVSCNAKENEQSCRSDHTIIPNATALICLLVVRLTRPGRVQVIAATKYSTSL